MKENELLDIQGAWELVLWMLKENPVAQLFVHVAFAC
jgi:hypothetical protein